MFSFILSIIALVLGYYIYGRVVERVFGPDDRPTPAVAKADGVDFMVLPSWKIFMIQFLNIAGTGPIFGAIMGAQFGPAAYLWIVFGCIFAGAVHDYLSGMLSIRHGGENLPNIIGHYLGSTTKQVMLVFSVFLLMMVGVVFVFSPAKILGGMWEPTFFVDTFGQYAFWIVIIFVYYIIATMMPIDKIIGKIYPLFAFSLLFMAAALMVMLFVKQPHIPEVWEGVSGPLFTTDNLFPCLFITIACGAISGFHATQTPLMARCVKSEKMGRPMFYGAMITEGMVALVWATVAMYFFYDSPEAGYTAIKGGMVDDTPLKDAPTIVNVVCRDWLGIAGGILALLGVVAAPITSGDTAFRSCRLIVAEFLRIGQRTIRQRFTICLPMFAIAIALLVWQMANPNGFNTIWSWFGWSNQTLSVFTLWAITVYLVRQRRNYFITLVPAVFMTVVCTTFLVSEKIGPTLFDSEKYSHFQSSFALLIAGATTLLELTWFFLWHRKFNQIHKI